MRAPTRTVVCIEPAECDTLGMHVANVMALRMALSRLDVAPTQVVGASGTFVTRSHSGRFT